jgi:D-proline reductase (dithiol) PrdB
MTLAGEDAPIPYLQRTRDWYLALGYGNPYRYAHFQEVPFQRLRKPLAECVVTLVTTAAPYQPDKGPQGPGAPYNAAAKFFVPYTGDTSRDHDVRISHVAIDRLHTSMEDANAWFPLPLMRRRGPAQHGAVAAALERVQPEQRGTIAGKAQRITRRQRRRRRR